MKTRLIKPCDFELLLPFNHVKRLSTIYSLYFFEKNDKASRPECLERINEWLPSTEPR